MSQAGPVNPGSLAAQSIRLRKFDMKMIPQDAVCVFIGRRRTGKPRVAKRLAAICVYRYFQCVEQRRARRLVGIGHVGVPHAARIRVTDILAVLFDVGDVENFRVVRMRVVLQKMRLHAAKAPREGDHGGGI